MRKKDLIPILLSVVLSVVFVAVAVNAATTISTLINTGGTLNVDGATTLNGNVTLGNATSDTLTLSGATTTLADTTTISSGSMDGTTLRSIYIVPKASVATAGVNYHKLIEIDGIFGDVGKRTYGLVAGFSRDDATTADVDGVDTGFDLRVTNDPVNNAGYEMQGAYIKAKNDGNGDGTGGSLATLKGLYVEAQNEEFATATTLIGLDVGVLADGTEVTGTGLNIRTLTGGDRSVNTFSDIRLQYGETIDNITDGTVAISGTTTMAAGSKIGSSGTALNIVLTGTCTVDFGTSLTAELATTTDCTAAGVLVGDKVFMTPIGLEKRVAFNSASSTTNGKIQVQVFNTSTSTAVTVTSHSWYWMATR